MYNVFNYNILLCNNSQYICIVYEQTQGILPSINYYLSFHAKLIINRF